MKTKVNMLEIKKFRRVHRLLQWILKMFGFILTARALFVITEAHQLFVNENNWALALLPMFVGLALAMVLGWSYRFSFPAGVPANDTTDIISPSHFNRAGSQLVLAFLKGVCWLVLALLGIWAGSLIA